jgi:hypothetical protein
MQQRARRRPNAGENSDRVDVVLHHRVVVPADADEREIHPAVRVGPVLVTARTRRGLLRVGVEAEVEHRAHVQAEQPRDGCRHDEFVRAGRVEHAARADRDAIGVDVVAVDARVGAELEVGRRVAGRRELLAVREQRRRVETSRRRDAFDVRQLRELAEDDRVVAARLTREAVRRGRQDEVGGMRAAEERRVRGLRSPRPRERADRDAADEREQQRDRQVATDPGPPGRPEAVAGDPQ